MAGEFKHRSVGSELDSASEWEGTDLHDFDGGVDGDIMMRFGGALRRLAAGTSGHVLTTMGAGAAPAWAASNSGHYNVASYGIVGDDITNDTAALVAMLAAVPTGATIFVPDTFVVKITSTVTINKRLRFTGGGTFHQTTLDADAFLVTVSGVVWDNITILGNSSEGAAGSSFGINHNIGLADCQILGCDISGFYYNIFAYKHLRLKVRDCYLHNCMIGVVGGHSSKYTSEDYYEITHNNIEVEYGSLSAARPIYFAYAQHYNVSHNRCRGGGMAIENTVSALNDVASASRIIVDNDCDTAISLGNECFIFGNTIDAANAPAGRGPQSDFYQAIESGFNSVVIGNIVRNHTNGVGNVMPGMVVALNEFINCGDQGGAAGVGMGGIIVHGTDSFFAVDTVMHAKIFGNIFRGTKGTVREVYINWGGAVALSAIDIHDNQSYDAASGFLLCTSLRASRVRDNLIYNSMGADATATAWPIRASGLDSSIEFVGNTVINTLTGGYGAYQGIAPQPGDIIGFNKFEGLRLPGTPIYSPGARQFTAPQLSDGLLIDIHRQAAAPTEGNWNRGDIVWNSGAAAGVSAGWICITPGTFSTATDNTGDTDGATGVITGMTDTSDFYIGEYVTVSAGFATTGPYRITGKTATSITVNVNSNAIANNITVATPDPVFALLPNAVLRATATWDPGNVLDGAAATVDVTCTGAALGDIANVSFSLAVPGNAALTAQVTAGNTVTVTLTNHTGAPLDLASGTLAVTVQKF